MKPFPYARQQGAALLVALVMLLILTVLAVGSMRGVVLESHITGNRAEHLRLQTSAEAALREPEFRFYGPAHLRDKLEPNSINCQKNNRLQDNGANKPCLLDIATEDQRAFMLAPLEFLNLASIPDEEGTEPTSNTSGADTDKAGETEFVAWMPYRGKDSVNDTSSDFPAYWNSLLIAENKDDSALNAEYGAVMEGRGTYFYLVNGQAADRLAVQSTTANIYLGLNN
ncbi:PilX N-terminal domain-containing pilus assembly protein [Serpens gallinarum]|jgi:type IV pilus assembly protein PilX|uniref:Pilus assembly protein PilX n=1 Tax=Serpens gallinarum TaxID=2763075 RepID=A0ABR8TQF4_9PSED|nr:PilX N-terminal domain-containing pilus assembly protein [Serpens gallinarum]MBD7977698.1 pilus assembly protein PilX [Serpens gallinarum]